MRASPAQRVQTPDGTPAWLLTRFCDVRAALTDPRVSGSEVHSHGRDFTGYALPRELRTNLINSESPAHGRLRQSIAPGLTSDRIAPLGPHLRDTATRLLAPYLRRREPFDLVTRYAGPLTVELTRTWLNLPTTIGEQFSTWSAALIDPTPTTAPRARDSLATMRRLTHALIDAKRVDPADDLVSTLVHAHDTTSTLSHDELVSMVFYLLFVWHEASIDAIGNAVIALWHDPAGLAELRASGDVARAAVDELMRFDTAQPMAFRRFATTDLPIGDVTIPAGDTIVASLAAANRDPEAFTDPADLDLTRTPNPHLSFGHGIHGCPGATLARLHLQQAITAVVRTTAQLHPTGPSIRYRPGFRGRGPRELPMMP
ncbi:cytochrome P450 [Actinoplanes sp. NEAU-A12]|uniref:Cytochrome P450 n=1 Tax=Actinoplanes sandaracinus TaxID=3045177 RepID=A0ABT6WHS5_9ACTN|nr:cytochrome P450 [Actinoplanes sandaracinus]MDI6099279.1 cytochrome P450 [Actinoplanes sandaracinus]